jgi:hypothetical protein
MPNWDKIKKNVGNIASKTATKTRELTDTAALKLKIATKEAERDAEYKRLGKLAYVKLKELEGFDTPALTESIAASLASLDKIIDELNALKKEDDARKAEKQAQKDAKKAEKEKENEPDEELNLAVMTEFNEARVEADEEYEKAKAQAEELK